jgi:hypothetical protein
MALSHRARLHSSDSAPNTHVSPKPHCRRLMPSFFMRDRRGRWRHTQHLRGTSLTCDQSLRHLHHFRNVLPFGVYQRKHPLHVRLWLEVSRTCSLLRKVTPRRDPFPDGQIETGAFGAVRPNLVSGVPLWIANPNVAGGKEINSAAFTIAPGAVQGDLGRNAPRGFGATEVDFALRRQFKLRERLSFRRERTCSTSSTTPTSEAPSTT